MAFYDKIDFIGGYFLVETHLGGRFLWRTEAGYGIPTVLMLRNAECAYRKHLAGNGP